METEDGAPVAAGAGADALAREFCRLGVADRSELVAAMRSALGESLCADVAAFYLDMNDWNLQAAVGCYLDLRCSSATARGATSMRVLAVRPECLARAPPLADFEWAWSVANDGSERWPEGCALRAVDDSVAAAFDFAAATATPLAPGGAGWLKVGFKTPETTGVYSQQFRLCTPQGLPFGEALWMTLVVEPNQQVDVITDYNMC